MSQKKESVSGYFVYEVREKGWNDCFRVEDDDGMAFVTDKLKAFHGRPVTVTIEVSDDFGQPEALNTRNQRDAERKALLADPEYAESLRTVEHLRRVTKGWRKS